MHHQSRWAAVICLGALRLCQQPLMDREFQSQSAESEVEWNANNVWKIAGFASTDPPGQGQNLSVAAGFFNAAQTGRA
jgi:hypothetical protein